MSNEGPPNQASRPSWKEAARRIEIPQREHYPVIPEFEKSVMTSMRVTGTQLVCGICPHCKRPLIESVLESHVAECEQENHIKQEDAGAAAAAAVEVELSASEAVKRRHSTAEPEMEPEAKKPRAVSKKAKPAKPPKVPRQTKQAKQQKEKPVVVYNPDKNCGTILPNGQPCMRSLTCKQHSMGAKRAVAGRSAPYDVLLSNYHRQHQVRQAQLSVSAAQAAQLESDQEHELQAQKNPEKEVQQVLEGVSRVQCQPLARHTLLESRTRVKSFRMREMFAVALLPRRIAVTGDVLYARSLGFRPDAPDDLTGIRAPAVQQAFMMARMQQQRQQQLRQQMLQQQQQQQQLGAKLPDAREPGK